MDNGARLAALFRAHKDAVHRVGLRYGRGRRSFADDIVQETFLKAWQNIDTLRDDGAGGWLYVVATRACLSRLRKEAVRNNPLVAWLMPAPTAPSPDAVVELSAEAAASIAHVEALPAKQRVAFWMVHVDERPLADVASTLGCSVSYASKLVSRAEATLRALAAPGAKAAYVAG